MSVSAVIFGCAGPQLLAEERAFFEAVRPWGFILFQRNCERPKQIAELVAALRACVGRPDAPVLIDQEGGRVQRLKPPLWRAAPEARRFGGLFDRAPGPGRESLFLNVRLIADELTALGITVDCLPVLDVPVEGAHDIIGDRAFSRDPLRVAELGRVACEALLAGGVLPVIKHIPGHGRATADSHLSLPRVTASREALRQSDFVPFRALRDMPLAMTAHVVYEAFDPERPTTTSPIMVGEVIRGEIGFDGLLMTDDLSMKALAGHMEARCAASLAAGCDMLLHCNGDADEMAAIARAAPPLAGAARRRADAALARLAPPERLDVAAARQRLDALLMG